MGLQRWESDSIQALKNYAKYPTQRLYIQKGMDGFKRLEARDASAITVWETIQKFFGFGPASLANISRFLNKDDASNILREYKSADNQGFNKCLGQLNEKILLAIKTRKIFGKPEQLACLKKDSPSSIRGVETKKTIGTEDSDTSLEPSQADPLPVLTREEQLSLVKIGNLKEQHQTYLLDFREWANEDQWGMFDHKYSHYDWWMFPIDKTSASHGTKYQLNQREIEKLKNDAEFMKDYREGVKLVLKSWGWDVDADKGAKVKSPKELQEWKGYRVRLGKMADSLSLFEETELYDQVKKFYTEVVHDQDKINDWVSDMCTKGHAIEYMRYVDNTLPYSPLKSEASVELIKDATVARKDGILTVSLNQFPSFNVSIRKQDIFDSGAEVVVNAANTHLGGGGGIDGLIHKNGGKSYKEAHARLATRFESKYTEGAAVIITSGDLLKAHNIQNVIVVAGPQESDSDKSVNQLYSCYYNSLVLAHLQQKKSIAFPSISTGIFGYPKDKAATGSIRAIYDFVTRHPDTTLKTISVHFLPKEADSVLSDYEHALGKTEQV